MNKTSDFINALADGKIAKANNTFDNIIKNKIIAALDARKIQIANDTFNNVDTLQQGLAVDANVQADEK